MSIQIVNGFTGPVVLTSAGRSYTLPSGFNGSLTLDGVCTVAGGGQTYQVPEYGYGETHASTITLVNSTGGSGQFYSDVGSNYWSSAPAVHPYGSPIYFAGGYGATYSLVPGTLPNGVVMNVGAVPNGVANLVFTITEPSLGVFAMSYAGSTYNDAISTNSLTTNTSSTSLGTFTASATVRSVEIDSAGLNVTDFEAEATAVAAGFMLAATIAAFRYVMRLARAVTSQGGDF